MQATLADAERLAAAERERRIAQKARTYQAMNRALEGGPLPWEELMRQAERHLVRVGEIQPRAEQELSALEAGARGQ